MPKNLKTNKKQHTAFLLQCAVVIYIHFGISENTKIS